MAYVAPSTRAAGALITAAIWNQDVVANPIAIYAGGMSISGQATNYVPYASSATQLAVSANFQFTGTVLTLANSSVTGADTPVYSFVGATDTGLWAQTSPNIIRINAAGTRIASFQKGGGALVSEIDISSNVGYGTGSVPGAKLTIGRNISGSGAAGTLALTKRDGTVAYVFAATSATQLHWVPSGNPPFESDANDHLIGRIIWDSTTLPIPLTVSNGGTGATSLTSNALLTGNGTSAIQAEDDLTWSPGSALFARRDGSNTPGDATFLMGNTAETRAWGLRLDASNGFNIDYYNGTSYTNYITIAANDGELTTESSIYVKGDSGTFSGSGLRLGHNGTRAIIEAYDRPAGPYRQLEFDATDYQWFISGVERMSLSSAGLLTVSGFGTHSIAATGTGTQRFVLQNSSAGTANITQLASRNDVGTEVQLLAKSSTHSADPNTASVFSDAWPTTASAANAQLADSNSLRRSTSSLAYKDVDHYITLNEARQMLHALPMPILYSGKTDEDKRLWLGYGAEDMAPRVPVLATYDKDGKPNYVTYDRFGAVLAPIVADHDTRLSTLEARVALLEAA